MASTSKNKGGGAIERQWSFSNHKINFLSGVVENFKPDRLANINSIADTDNDKTPSLATGKRHRLPNELTKLLPFGLMVHCIYRGSQRLFVCLI